MSFAFRRLVDGSRAISLASRYESRLHRIHERSHRILGELQNNPSVSAGARPQPHKESPTPFDRETSRLPQDRYHENSALSPVQERIEYDEVKRKHLANGLVSPGLG